MKLNINLSAFLTSKSGEPGMSRRTSSIRVAIPSWQLCVTMSVHCHILVPRNMYTRLKMKCVYESDSNVTYLTDVNNAMNSALLATAPQSGLRVCVRKGAKVGPRSARVREGNSVRHIIC